MKKFCLILLCLGISACAKTQTIRTSSDTLLIQTSGAPACGIQGAMGVAQKMAAIETLRAGYHKYQIIDADSQNNVSSQTLPGSYHTNAYVTGNSNYASYSGSTYYQPGATIYNGSNDVAFHIKMFKEKQKGSSKAISAKEILGSDWQKLVETGVNTCSD